MYELGLQWADSYFSNRFSATVWNATSEEGRQKALNSASLIIDAMFTFPEGTFFVDANGLDLTSVRIRAAIAEQANWLLSVDPTVYPSVLTLGLASAGAAGASMSTDRTMLAPLVSNTAKSLIGSLGTFYDASGENITITSFPLQNNW